ncbi:hypothetical protein BJ742DRAFT_239383 [Cladochytrium replicatum]|nr:hypothetical protein BJ742DRAFT_239383 [Cladochytrium replicatum]
MSGYGRSTPASASSLSRPSQFSNMGQWDDRGEPVYYADGTLSHTRRPSNTPPNTNGLPTPPLSSYRVEPPPPFSNYASDRQHAHHDSLSRGDPQQFYYAQNRHPRGEYGRTNEMTSGGWVQHPSQSQSIHHPQYAANQYPQGQMEWQQPPESHSNYAPPSIPPKEQIQDYYSLPTEDRLLQEISYLKGDRSELAKRITNFERILQNFARYADELARVRSSQRSIENEIGMLRHKLNENTEARYHTLNVHLGVVRSTYAERTKQIARLAPLANVQQHVELELRDKVEREKTSKEEVETVVARMHAEMEARDTREHGWMSEMPTMGAQVDGIRAMVNEAMAVVQGQMPRVMGAQQEVNRRLADVQRLQMMDQIVRKSLMIMGGTVNHVLMGMMNYIVTTKGEAGRLNAKLEWRELTLKMEEISQSTEMDKLIPEWNNPRFDWPLQLELRIRRYVPTQGIQHMFGNIALPFDGKTWTADKRQLKFYLMGNRFTGTAQGSAPVPRLVLGKPFSKGAFRTTRYAKGSDNNPYVVKVFHLRRDLRKDSDAAEKVGMANAVVAYCARLFSMELRSAGLAQYEVEYVDAWVAPCSAYFTDEQARLGKPENTCLMIEPLLPSFKKWLNNNMQVFSPEPGDMDADMMACLAHWSYERSLGTLIIADLQGCRVDTDLGGGMMRYRWQLCDPAVHFLRPQDPLVQSLRHDFDGDHGQEAEMNMKVKFRHECNPFCRHLRLQPIQ